MTKVELENILVADMYLFFEKGMRGGVSDISNRYSKANINIKNLVTQNKNKRILFTSTQIVYMVMPCLNFFLQVDLEG